MEVTPLFKTHASIGKSILQNDDILEIQKENNLDKVVVVEDSFYGFRELNEKIAKTSAQLIFGIRLGVKQNLEDELNSKLIFFAKNDEGVKQIKNLYTRAHCGESGVLILAELQAQDTSDIKVAVPFYDSFVYQNIFHFGLCEVDLKPFDHVFFEEDNDHPFDRMISTKLQEISGSNKEPAKSIYYHNREDIDAFQFYKSACSRSGGKSPNFGNPNLEHFCSAEFCWESYLEKKIKFSPSVSCCV